LCPSGADRLPVGGELTFDDDAKGLNLNPGSAFRRKSSYVHEERSDCPTAERLESSGGLGATRAKLQFDLNCPLPAVLDTAAPDSFQRLGRGGASSH
jgi:hypothetical protein